MEKKILVALDASVHSQQAVQYLESFQGIGPEFRCTLFNVQPAISSFLLEEAKTSGKANAELKKIIQNNAQAAHRFLTDYKERMVRQGWKADAIEAVTHPRIQGTAKDILDYAQAGLFDAIVTGRRGITRTQEIFTGSVTANLLEHSRLIPVWVVDATIQIRRMLVSVDGSQSAVRVIEHLAHILEGAQSVHLTLFHVGAKPKAGTAALKEDVKSLSKLMAIGDRRHIDTFMQAARNRLMEAGITDGHIEIRISGVKRNTGNAIVDEVKKGGYDTVVVGRSGESRAFFMGSVSRTVLRKMTGAAVWLVP